jgi:small conductance mechanosensitive channel
MEIEKINSYSDQLIDLLIKYAPQVAGALLILIIGWIIINAGVKFLRKIMRKREVDESLIPFLGSLFNVALKTMLLISVAQMVGVEATSFVAVLGAAGLAIGLALQGSLSNFAGGVLILLFRPYKVGDVIEAQGVIAAVHAIQIFNTILKTYDNKTIIIPNGALSNDKIINYTTEDTRLVEWVFGIGYEDEIDKAKNVLQEIIFSDSRIIDKDAPFIKLAELGDSSVNFKVRARVKTEDYWDVFFDMTERVKKAFDEKGISIPFPQRDVHLYNNK